MVDSGDLSLSLNGTQSSIYSNYITYPFSSTLAQITKIWENPARSKMTGIQNNINPPCFKQQQNLTYKYP